MKTDVLCLIESQICANVDRSDVREELRSFAIDFNSRGKKFENLEFCIEKSINVVQHQKIPVISLLDIRKPAFH